MKKKEDKRLRKVKFKPENYVTVYEMARRGVKLGGIAKSLGVSIQTLKDWLRSDSGLLSSYRKGKELSGAAEEKPGAKFLEYVYKRLPESLQDVYESLVSMNSPDSDDNSEKRIELVLKDCGKRERQVLFVHALIGANFNAAEACRMVNVPYQTLMKWKESDPEFHQLMDTIHFMKKDYCEGALMNLIHQGDTSAIIFANRTLNKDRGYDPKVVVEHKGSLSHKVEISQLPLPPEVLRQILKAMGGEDHKELPESAVRVLPAYEDTNEEDFGG